MRRNLHTAQDDTPPRNLAKEKKLERKVADIKIPLKKRYSRFQAQQPIVVTNVSYVQ